MSNEVYTENQYYHIGASGGIYQITTQRCLLDSVIVNTLGAGVIIISDSSSTETNNVASLKASVTEGVYKYEVVMSKGLRVNSVSSTTDITITYRIV